MPNSSKEKKNKFGGFWTVVEDYESATKAAKSGSIAAFYVVFSYAVITALTYFTGSDLYGNQAADEIELYVGYGINILIIVLFLWLGFRIRKEKFGSVPFVAIWLLFEIGYKFVEAPGKGILMSIIFTIVALNALVGWYKRKQYVKAEAQN